MNIILENKITCELIIAIVVIISKIINKNKIACIPRYKLFMTINPLVAGGRLELPTFGL